MIPMKNLTCLLVVAVTTLLLGAASPMAAENGPARLDKSVKCPVCGMFVYKYPDWVVVMTYKDNSAEYFDGVKDMFKYYFNPGKYRTDRTRNDIGVISVMEYYDMRTIDAYKAFFVIGSDIYGPMGHELIALATREDAQHLLQDHHGKKILSFDEITPATIDGLD